MHIGLLGELEVLDDDGNEITIAGAKLRALLAVLALHVGRVVSAEHLVDALWGEDPPAAVRNGLQGLASKLRRALGSADLVVMRGDGYVLDLPPDAIDVGQFEQRAADGRALAAAGELERAVDVLAEADSLWRGDPLADFAYDDFAASAITRLSESRLALLEERLDLELQLGRHQRAVVQLEELVARPSAARGVPWAADAGAVPRRAAGRCAAGLPGGSPPPGRGARPRTGARAAPVGVGDPHPGPVVDPAGRVRSGARRCRRRRSHPGIPEALTPLVGRDAELRELRELFAEQRFVTLVGPGRGGQDAAGPGGRAGGSRRARASAGAWSSWRPSVIPPVSRRRSPRPSACRTRTGSPR